MYCILGQGLAGTALAFRFEEAGIAFKIIDDGHKSSSSVVAAGLWNPIVFRRVNKSYLADEFLEAQEKFYNELEKKLGIDFYFPLPIIRVHPTKWELDTWFEKRSLPAYHTYLTDETPEWGTGKFSEMPFRAHRVNHSGHLDAPLFLQAARKYFLQTDSLLELEVNLPEKSEEFSQIGIAGLHFDKLIDCRGYKSALSKWWDYLPFGLTKGETLTVQCPGLDLQEVYNSGIFILPLGDDLYRVGATFNWDDPTPHTTDAGLNELSEKFEEAVKLPFHIIDHQAGVRPTVQDRRPLIGKHPIISNFLLFNGMGAKGVMMTPYFSKIFINYLQNDSPLPADADIERYDKFWGLHNPQINHPVK